MVNLALDVMTDILARLPPKPLMRFKCVCKSWYRLIRDSNFIKLHLGRDHGDDNLNLLLHKEIIHKEEHLVAKSQASLSLCYESHMYCVDRNSLFAKAIQFENPLVPSLLSTARLVGCCNGIVCLVRTDAWSYHVCLWNPYTREYKFVEFEVEDLADYAIWGFGYDAPNDNYKLVRFSYSSRVDVYSLNNASCSTISNIPYTVSRIKELGIFVNGAVHWLGRHIDSNARLVIAFDIGEEVFTKIERPDCLQGAVISRLGELEGQLCMVCKKHGGDIQIWVMTDYGVGDSWSKLFAIETSVLSEFTVNTTLVKPLCFVKTDEVLLVLDKSIILYDPKKRSARKLESHGVSDWSEMDRIMTYIPSLVGMESGTYIGFDIGDEIEEQTH